MTPRTLAVALASATLLLLSEAVAEEPACFPERTVMWKSALRSADGRVIGGLRAAYPLKVLSDRAGENGEDAEIETTEPVKIRGRVERSSLVVFARKDIELAPGWKWLRADSALRIVEGDGTTAEVALADPRCGKGPSWTIRVQCSELLGTPPRSIQRDWCHGATVGGAPPGKPVHWPDADRLVKSADGSRQELLRKGSPAWLVRREKSRVLVDVLATERYVGRVRYRGWTAAAGMVERSPGYSIGLCCEGMLIHSVSDNSTRMASAFVLRDFPELAKAKVPRLLAIRLVSKFRDAEIPAGQVRPGWFWPANDPEGYSFVLLGPLLKAPSE